jgi:hypothetical protein
MNRIFEDPGVFDINQVIESKNTSSEKCGYDPE